jgi:hypothetical protein
MMGWERDWFLVLIFFAADSVVFLFRGDCGWRDWTEER